MISEDHVLFSQLHQQCASLPSQPIENNRSFDYKQYCMKMMCFNSNQSATASMQLACTDWSEMCLDRSEERLSCEESYIFEQFFLVAYMPLFVVCWLGNLTNMLVYFHRYWKSSTTIHLLLAKAIANIGFTTAMLSSFIKVVDKSNSRVQDVFWTTYPFALFLANVFGTVSSWLTLAMTSETFVYSVFPYQAESICTIRNARAATLLTMLLAAALQMFYPIAHRAQRVDCFDVVRHRLQLRAGDAFETYTHFCYWANALSVIIVPSLLICVLTVAITKHLRFKRRDFATYMRQKRSIIQISHATMLGHLVFETPNMLLFIGSTINSPLGAYLENPRVRCHVNVICNFLSLVSSSLMFFLYLGCSRKFRQLVWIRMRYCKTHGDSLSNAVARCSYNSLSFKESMIFNQHYHCSSWRQTLKKHSLTKILELIQRNKH